MVNSQTTCDIKHHLGKPEKGRARERCMSREILFFYVNLKPVVTWYM
jgi:hypothetical protein